LRAPVLRVVALRAPVLRVVALRAPVFRPVFRVVADLLELGLRPRSQQSPSGRSISRHPPRTRPASMSEEGRGTLDRRGRTLVDRARAVSDVACAAVPVDDHAGGGGGAVGAKVVVALRHPLIPYLSRMTTRIEGKRPESTGTRSARHRPHSACAAGHGTAPAQPLKVETRVRTPLGLRRSGAISGLRVSEWPRIGPAAHTRPSLIALVHVRCIAWNHAYITGHFDGSHRASKWNRHPRICAAR
jgi:hypothetical protein